MELARRIVVCFIALMIAFSDYITVEPQELVESPLVKEIELKKSFLFKQRPQPIAKASNNIAGNPGGGRRFRVVNNGGENNIVAFKPARRLNSGTNSEPTKNVRYVIGIEEVPSLNQSILNTTDGIKKSTNEKETPTKDRVLIPPYKLPFWGLPYGVYSNAGVINPGLFPFVPGGPGFPPFDGIFGGPFGPGAFPGKQNPFPPGVGTPMFPPGTPGQPPLYPTGNSYKRKLKPGPPTGAYSPGSPMGYKKPPASGDKPKATKAPSKSKAKPKPSKPKAKPKTTTTTPEPETTTTPAPSCPCSKSEDDDSPPPSKNKYYYTTPAPDDADSDEPPMCPCLTATPKPKKKKKKVIPVDDDDDDDDDGDDDDDISNAPPPKKKKPTPAPCPFALKTTTQPPSPPPEPPSPVYSPYVPPPVTYVEPPPPPPPPPEITTAKPYVPPETTTTKPYEPPVKTVEKPDEPPPSYPKTGYRRPLERDYDSETPSRYYNRPSYRDYESDYYRRPSQRDYGWEPPGRYYSRKPSEPDYEHEPQSRYYERSPESHHGSKHHRKRPRHESDARFDREPPSKSYEKDAQKSYNGSHDDDDDETSHTHDSKSDSSSDPLSPRPKCNKKHKYRSSYTHQKPEPTTTTTPLPLSKKPCPYKLRRLLNKYNATKPGYTPVGLVYTYPPDPESESQTNDDPATTSVSGPPPPENILQPDGQQSYSDFHDHDHDLETEASHSEVVYQPNPKDIVHTPTSVTVPLPFTMLTGQSKSQEPNTVTYKLDLSEELLTKLTTPIHVNPQQQAQGQIASSGNAFLVGGQPVTIGNANSMGPQQMFSNTVGTAPQLVAPQQIAYSGNTISAAPEFQQYSSHTLGTMPQVVAQPQSQPLIVLNSSPQHQPHSQHLIFPPQPQPQHLILPPSSQPQLQHLILPPQPIVLNSPSIYDHQTSPSVAAVSYLSSPQTKSSNLMQNYPSLQSSDYTVILPESKNDLSIASKLVSPYQILSYPRQQQQQRRLSDSEFSRNYVLIDKSELAELADLRGSSRSNNPENIPPPPEVVHISFHSRNNEQEESNKPLSFPDNYFVTSKMPSYSNSDYNPGSTNGVSQFSNVFDMNNMEGLLRSPSGRFRRGKTMDLDKVEKENKEEVSLDEYEPLPEESKVEVTVVNPPEDSSKKIENSATEEDVKNNNSEGRFHITDAIFRENVTNHNVTNEHEKGNLSVQGFKKRK